MNQEKYIEQEKIIEIGRILRNRRVEKNLSGVDMAINLNLNFAYINKIEQGLVKQDDNIFYLGYISSMAKFLGLNQREILSHINSNFEKTNIEKTQPKAYDKGILYTKLKENNRSNSRYKIEIIFLISGIIAVTIFYNLFFK